jgi:hypothetical protein
MRHRVLYARKTADFPGIKGKESCKKWQHSFYTKNLKEGNDHINLPPFEAGRPERDNWSAALPRPSPDMEEILLQITTLQMEGGLCRWISCRKNTGYHTTDPKI